MNYPCSSFGIFWAITALSIYAFPQSHALSDIQIKGIKDSIHITLNFQHSAPGYDINTTKNEEIAMAVVTIPKGKAYKTFNPEVIRPVLHVEAIRRASENELDIIFYLENEVHIGAYKTSQAIHLSMPWSAYQPLKGKLSRLNRYSVEQKEENNELFKFSFNRLPSSHTIFLSKNKKSAIAVLHNTLTEGNVIPPPQSSLITNLQPKTGLGKDFLHYTKLVFSSDQELLMDVADEGKELFIEFYGVGDASSITMTEPEEEEYNPDEYGTMQSEKKSESSNAWIYVSLGTAAVISGGIAAYLLWLTPGNDTGNDTGGDWPKPENEIKFPDEPSE